MQLDLQSPIEDFPVTYLRINLAMPAAVCLLFLNSLLLGMRLKIYSTPLSDNKDSISRVEIDMKQGSVAIEDNLNSILTKTRRDTFAKFENFVNE